MLSKADALQTAKIVFDGLCPGQDWDYYLSYVKAVFRHRDGGMVLYECPYDETELVADIYFPGQLPRLEFFRGALLATCYMQYKYVVCFSDIHENKSVVEKILKKLHFYNRAEGEWAICVDLPALPV